MLADELGVDVLDVCQNMLGIEGDVIVDEYVCLCPDPKHSDTHPSCGINLGSGLFHCWSCGANGDLISLVMLVMRLSYLKARHLLSPEGTDGKRTVLQHRLRGLQKPPGDAKPLSSGEDRPWLPEGAREPHSYRGRCQDIEASMIERGLEPETLRAWGIRYVRADYIPTRRGQAEIRNSVAIPLLDTDGVVQAWQYRRTNGSAAWQPRYLNTIDAPLGDFWHGMHLVGTSNAVVVCEGATDGMWIYQCGFPVLTMMGSNVPEAKVMMLSDFPKVVLFTDRDLAGTVAAKKLGELLWRQVPTYVARYPRYATGQDPAELAPIDVELAIHGATPWTAWALRDRLLASKSAA